MLKNHLKLAFRRLIKNRFYTLINLLGLSVGFASVLIICLFLRKERSFDKFHSKLDRIEHLVRVTQRDNVEERSTATSGPVLLDVAPRFPQIEAFSRYRYSGYLSATADTSSVSRDKTNLRIFIVDPDFLKVFDFKLKYGNYPDFEKNPRSILITENKAKALFKTSHSAIGRSIFDAQKKEFVVAGVLEDIPESSSLQFDMLSSIQDAYPSIEGKVNLIQMWGNNIMQNVVLFKEGTTESQKDTILEEIEEVYRNQTAAFSKLQSEFDFQPFSEAHFDLNMADGFYGKMDEYYLVIFSAIALVILFASLANYCSLTLSQSVERVKEIGVRRTVGASKTSLVGHFFFEASLLTTLAFVFSLILIELSLPTIEGLTGKPLGVDLFADIGLLFQCFLGVLVLSFASVLYPAYISSKKKLSDFKPFGGSSVFTKSSFIYFINGIQAAIFIFLLAATMFVNQQLDFVQNKNLGFNKDQVLMVSVNTRESYYHKEVLKEVFSKSPFVEYAAISMSWPTEKSSPRYAEKEQIDFIEYRAEAEFLDILDFQLIEGRTLENLDYHKQYVLLNETAVNTLGYEEPIGKEFNGKEILGVVADFHAESKRELIKPLAISLFEQDGFGWILMRLSTDNIQAAVADVLERYEGVTGSSKITYKFFNDEYDKIYASEKVIKYLMQIFTGIALLISFLGVFGSSSYTVRRRVKEISIRKVLGANLIDLNRAINKSSLSYLIISVLVAIPLSYWWINDWLAQFSYQINIGAVSYMPVVLITILLIIPAMLYQVIKVYHSKTISYLKDE